MIIDHMLVASSVLVRVFVAHGHQSLHSTHAACTVTRWAQIFMLLDVMLCTASILNLTALSLDRFLIITRPFQYTQRRTTPLMLSLIACVWITALVVSASAHLWPESPPDASTSTSASAVAVSTAAQTLSQSATAYNSNNDYHNRTYNSTDSYSYEIAAYAYQSGTTFGPAPQAYASAPTYPPCDYPPFLTYQLYATATAFYAPMVLICLLWSRIFCVARRMSLVDRKQSDLRER